MTYAKDTCAARPAQKGHPVEMARMMGLETAATMLGGVGALADAIGIKERGTRAKMDGERGISDDNLIAVADALDKRADAIAARATKITEHAQKLRKEAGRA
ncbi:hypothetical protein ACWGNZ_00935 [Sphingomonas zeae]